MLDSLGKGLTSVIRKITTGTSVDKKAVEELLVEIKKILMQADVDTNLVDDLVKRIKKRAIDDSPPAGMTLREHVTKVIYEELVSLLGGEPASLVGKKRIMLVGLYGSGKTTTSGKLARYLSKQGLKIGLIGADFNRPAAVNQIAQVGKQVGTSVFFEKDALTSVKKGLEKYKSYDSIIIDTAGRNALDGDLAKEIKEIAEIAKPDEILLVIPADIGKIVRTQAEQFHKLVGVTGIIISKMDGTAKAGGALSAASVTDAKVKFIGYGEHLDQFEVYDPTRFVSRLLGLGDIQTLLDKAKSADIKKESVEKIIEGKFTMDDLMEQIEAMQKMGPLDQVMSMIPGMGGRIPENVLKQQEEKMKKFKHIIKSMTLKEKENPDIVNSSRIKRIALGSGRSESDVRELLNQYSNAKKMMRQMGGAAGMQRGQLKNMAKQFGFKL